MRNTRHRALIQLLVALPVLGLIKPAVVAAHTCAKGNCVNGQGLLVYPDGGSYEGQFKDGRFEGRGIKIFDDGGSYEGEFKGGRYEGKGTRVWGSGEKYVGANAQVLGVVGAVLTTELVWGIRAFSRALGY